MKKYFLMLLATCMLCVPVSSSSATGKVSDSGNSTLLESPALSTDSMNEAGTKSDSRLLTPNPSKTSEADMEPSDASNLNSEPSSAKKLNPGPSSASEQNLEPSTSSDTRSAPSTAPLTRVKAAFIRDGNLWVLIGGKEKQVTSSGKIQAKPVWSSDGNLLAYQESAPAEFKQNGEQSELWVYEIATGEKKKVFHDGHYPKWAPRKNELAFKDGGILDISDLKGFYNIATGVEDYTWFPDGNGFLLSASGTLRPDGWSSATLFKKKLAGNYKDVILFGGVEPFFQLPKEIGTTKDNQLIAVFLSQLTFSPSGKWISFIVSPTASWSMDSNMVCVIDSDGKRFTVLDEIIFEVGSPKWAPSEDTIAYIAGGGRIVFGFKNKDLKVREMPASVTLTPSDYADIDFDWIDNKSLVAARIREQEWSNDFSKHPLPVLYSIDIPTGTQTKLTSPPSGYGDYAPQYVSTAGKLVWLRGESILNKGRTLWRANPDGSQAEKWLDNVDSIVFFEK
ncbi:PD40 domain-containing protein [Bacillus sp. FJAT-18017]|uniref:PD40 domain-containing protein n=1 Tax=Bacillus sp. FJAT-18017 TaxID=1705566 RepID=UPI0006ADD4BD|nr:PD40 domain-containing protein [Bacillus sp. FJAT-18017]